MVAQWVRNPTSIHEDARVQFLTLLRGLRIPSCHELWCRLQRQLGSPTAVAGVWAGTYSSASTPSLGTSTCHVCGPKKQKKKKKKKKKHRALFKVPLLTFCITPGKLQKTEQIRAPPSRPNRDPARIWVGEALQHHPPLSRPAKGQE